MNLQKKITKKKLFFFIPFAFVCLFVILLIIYNFPKKEKDKNKFNCPFREMKDLLSSIPKEKLHIVCLTRTDFPDNLNILKEYNNSFFQEMLNHLKQDVIENEYFLNEQTNEITLKIKPNLKFENEETINAQTLKNNLQLYIDCNLARDLLNQLDDILIKYIIEYREIEKKEILDNLIQIKGNLEIKVKLKKNVLPQQIIDYLNKKMFLISSQYLKNSNNNFNFNKYFLLSYGEYRINQFKPQELQLWLKKISNSDNNKKENIIYLTVNKKQQKKLFEEGYISFFEPLESILEDISYDDQAFNKEFLENPEKYRIEFQLDDWQLFLIFNLTTKENVLKIKIKEQLDYFKNYFVSKKENTEVILKIEEFANFINCNKEEEIEKICDEYNLLLKYILLQNENTKDKKCYNEHQTKLNKWKNIYLPHKILQDKDFRKAFYFAFDREKMVKDIFPFYKSSFYPVSELSELHYLKNNCILENLENFFDLKLISTKNENLIKESYNEEKAKKLFHQSWERLTPEEQKNKIILKINYNSNDERFKIIFKYFKEKIKNIFEDKIILKEDLRESLNSFEDLIKKNEQKENLSSIIDDFYGNCDLYIDFYPTLDFNNIIFSLLTKFYCNEKFNIDLSQELSLISDLQKELLKKCFRYSSKEFSGINEQGKLEGDIYLINAFFYKIKNSFLTNEQKQKIIFKLSKELDKKYFESLPAIPLFTLQKCIVHKNK